MSKTRNTLRLVMLLVVVAANAACSSPDVDIKVCVMYPKDVQAAIDACTRLIDNPTPFEFDRYAWFAARGNHKIKARDFKGAVADLDEAIRLRPNDPQLYEVRAEAHRLNGDTDNAARDLSRVDRLLRASARDRDPAQDNPDR